MSHKYVYVKVRRHIPAFDYVIESLKEYGYKVSMPEANATITLATELDETGDNIRIGWAVQNPTDKPNKKLARAIADGRLKTRPVILKREIGIPVEKLLANANLTDYSEVPALRMIQRLITNNQPTRPTEATQ